MLNFPEVGNWYSQFQEDAARQKIASSLPGAPILDDRQKSLATGMRRISTLTNAELTGLADLLFPQGYSPGYQMHTRFFSGNYCSRIIHVGRINGSALVMKITFLFEAPSQQLITAFKLNDSALEGNDFFITPITMEGDTDEYNALGLNFDFSPRIGIRQLYTHFRRELKMWSASSYGYNQPENPEIAALVKTDRFSSFLLQKILFPSVELAPATPFILSTISEN